MLVWSIDLILCSDYHSQRKWFEISEPSANGACFFAQWRQKLICYIRGFELIDAMLWNENLVGVYTWYYQRSSIIYIMLKGCDNMSTHWNEPKIVK